MRDHLVRTACVLLSVVLLIASLRYLTDFWLLSFFFSFQTHIGVAGIAASLVCLVLSRGQRGRFLLVAAVLLTGHSLVMKREFRPPAASAADAATATPLRLLSFNILGNNRVNAQRIAEMIATSGADVAYVFESAPLFPYLDALARTYPYRIGCGTATPTCDLLVLSKQPILKRTVASLSDLRQDRFAIADIEIGGKLVHFVAAHVSKPYFDDYHTEELLEISRWMRRIGGTFVIGGDFNSGTIAPDMQKFLRSNGLTAAGSEPATWPVRAGRFGIDIDHIFISPEIAARSLARIEDNMGSNHFGLIADLLVR